MSFSHVTVDESNVLAVGHGIRCASRWRKAQVESALAAHERVDDCRHNLIIVFIQRLRAQPRRVAQTIEADVLRADTEGSTRTNTVRVSFESMHQLISSCDFLCRIDLVEIASRHAVAHGVRTRASDISGVLRSHV
ncbi:hypothetical protein HYDPIDRAFT_119328, partial [Hydnomerulius pinastri MD-312]